MTSRLVDRLQTEVCRRAFSAPEALLYELTIAPALAAIAAPLVDPWVSGGLVADVGCGGGRLAWSIAQGGSATVVGVDASSAQVRRFHRRTRSTPSCAAALASASALPFPSSTFGTVLSCCAVKHWEDRRGGLAECLRVAAPGAAVVVVEIDGSASAAEVRRFAHRSRIPLGMREAYVRFAMRTVVGVAPSADDIRSALSGLGAANVDARRVEGLPFTLTTAVAPQPPTDLMAGPR